MTTTTFGKTGQQNMNQSSGVKCAVCQKNKHQLRNRVSKLSGQKMFVCNTCFENKFEPRWLIILIGQQSGPDRVSDFLLNRKYVGPEITGADLVK